MEHASFDIFAVLYPLLLKQALDSFPEEATTVCLSTGRNGSLVLSSDVTPDKGSHSYPVLYFAEIFASSQNIGNELAVELKKSQLVKLLADFPPANFKNYQMDISPSDVREGRYDLKVITVAEGGDLEVLDSLDCEKVNPVLAPDGSRFIQTGNVFYNPETFEILWTVPGRDAPTDVVAFWSTRLPVLNTAAVKSIVFLCHGDVSPEFVIPDTLPAAPEKDPDKDADEVPPENVRQPEPPAPKGRKKRQRKSDMFPANYVPPEELLPDVPAPTGTAYFPPPASKGNPAPPAGGTFYVTLPAESEQGKDEEGGKTVRRPSVERAIEALLFAGYTVSPPAEDKPAVQRTPTDIICDLRQSFKDSARLLEELEGLRSQSRSEWLETTLKSVESSVQATFESIRRSVLPDKS